MPSAYSHGDDGHYNPARVLEDNQNKLKQFFENANKPDPWLGEFLKVVKTKHNRMVKKLKDIHEQSILDRQTFQTTIAPLISAALQGLMDEPSDPTTFSLPVQVQYLGVDRQPYSAAMSDLLLQSGLLLVAYDELAGQQTHESRLAGVETSFKEDKQATESTIEAGKKLTMMEVEKLFTDRFNEVRVPYNLTGEEEHKGRLLLSRGVDKEEQPKQPLGWGNIASDMERAVEKLCFAGRVDSDGH